jgi:hypothetical protein
MTGLDGNLDISCHALGRCCTLVLIHRNGPSSKRGSFSVDPVEIVACCISRTFLHSKQPVDRFGIVARHPEDSVHETFRMDVLIRSNSTLRLSLPNDKGQVG